MAERQLSDVPDILEENVFDSGMSIMFSMSGRFRDIASLLLRNAISKAIIHAEDSDPADSHLVAGLTQYWINTDTRARFVSVNGEDWVNVTPADTPGEGEDGDDGWTPLLSIESDGNRSVLKVVDWTGGGGTKPGINQYLTASGFDTDIANAVDIRGLRGLQGIQGAAGLNAWTPVFEIISDNARRVMRIRAWTNGEGTPPASGQYLGASGPVADIAEAVDLRGPAGTPVNALASVATDETLQGDGTSESPLGVVANEASGEVGLIHLVGSYTFGTSSTPASEHAGYTGGHLYLHTTASDGDKSTVLGSLAQGDYIHVGTAILEITAAPTEASSVYAFPVAVLEGTVPDSGSETAYYIKENRALIAGAVHAFNIAAGAIILSKLAPEVLAYWLRTVATDATLTGDGTTGSPLSVVFPESDSSDSTVEIEVGVYTTFGSWAWTSTSAPATGQFYVESGELKIFETDSDSTDKRTALDDVAVGDRFQFGELNAFEVTAVGVRSGNGIWTFTGSWSEVFSVGDFDGTYSVRHIKKSNVLVRNNAVLGRHLKLSEGLMVETNDPDGDFETLWSGDFNQDSTGSQSLNAGKKFSDYTALIFEYVGYNSRHEQWFRRVHFQSRNRIEIGVESSKRMSINRVSDTSFSKQVSSGNITLTGIYGHRGL